MALVFSLLSSMQGQSLTSEPNVLTENERRDGWELLFDGKTTAGWRGLRGEFFPRRSWKVHDGCLTATGSAKDELFSVAKFTDFDLTFEWRVDEDFASMKYIVDERPTPPSRGNEFALAGLSRFLITAILAIGILLWRMPWLACSTVARILFLVFFLVVILPAMAILLESRSAIYQLSRTTQALGIWLTTDASKAGGLKISVPPDEKPTVFPKQFNRSRVFIEGNHVEHWVNGVKTLEFQLGSERLFEQLFHGDNEGYLWAAEKRTGPIALLSLGNRQGGGSVAFRNIKLKRSGK